MMSRRNISGYTGITINAMMITKRTHILYNLENTNLRSSAITFLYYIKYLLFYYKGAVKIAVAVAVAVAVV
jgi:hypothetical protein